MPPSPTFQPLGSILFTVDLGFLRCCQGRDSDVSMNQPEYVKIVRVIMNLLIVLVPTGFLIYWFAKPGKKFIHHFNSKLLTKDEKEIEMVGKIEMRYRAQEVSTPEEKLKSVANKLISELVKQRAAEEFYNNQISLQKEMADELLFETKRLSGFEIFGTRAELEAINTDSGENILNTSYFFR